MSSQFTCMCCHCSFATCSHYSTTSCQTSLVSIQSFLLINQIICQNIWISTHIIAYCVILWNSVPKYRSDQDLNPDHSITVTEHTTPWYTVQTTEIKWENKLFRLPPHHSPRVPSAFLNLGSGTAYHYIWLTALLLFTDSSTSWRLVKYTAVLTDITWLLATSILLIFHLTKWLCCLTNYNNKKNKNNDKYQKWLDMFNYSIIFFICHDCYWKNFRG